MSAELQLVFGFFMVMWFSGYGLGFLFKTIWGSFLSAVG